MDASERAADATTWFVTGASSGLGRLMTEALLDRGDRVAAALRDPARLDDLAARHGERLWRAELDVTDGAAVRAVVDRAFSALGRIDVVASNAGYGVYGAAEELSDDQIRRQLETNLFGSIAVVRAALPHLRAQGGGRIVQISSEGGQIAYPNFSAYHASKWGIEGFLESVALEVEPLGIGVMLVEPGPTATSFGANVERARAMPAYAATPSGEGRRAVANGTAFAEKADAAKVVREILAAAGRTPMPRRLVLGSGPFDRLRAAWTRRIDELDAQRPIAESVDAGT